MHMKINNVFKLIIAVGVAELAGVVGSLFTVLAIEGWYATLAKPALNPPSWVFGPVWTTLHLLIGLSLFLVWKNNWKVVNPVLEKTGKVWNQWSERLWRGDLQKVNAIAIFAVQYILNIAWSFVFFRMHSPLLASFVILALWVAILYTAINFYRISKPAAYLLLPYIFWVSFAAYLNYAMWALN